MIAFTGRSYLYFIESENAYKWLTSTQHCPRSFELSSTVQKLLFYDDWANLTKHVGYACMLHSYKVKDCPTSSLSDLESESSNTHHALFTALTSNNAKDETQTIWKEKMRFASAVFWCCAFQCAFKDIKNLYIHTYQHWYSESKKT